jgi:serine/threonine protein kinase
MAPQDAPPVPLGPLGQYQLLEKLGSGGMGTAYKARHSKLKRLVAIKILLPDRVTDRTTVARFHREMEAIARLDHPHIVRAYDAGEDGGTHFLVMEFVDGIDLSKLVRCLGPLPVADACELIRQAAVGLQHAHETGLVHRDIKPSNLILSVAGSRNAPGGGAQPEQVTVKILDLGLALLHGERPAGDELTASGQVMGTVDYMAP